MTSNPKKPVKYALLVLTTLFTEDELIHGMIAPINKKGTKSELDPLKIDMLKGKYTNIQILIYKTEKTFGRVLNGNVRLLNTCFKPQNVQSLIR